LVRNIAPSKATPARQAPDDLEHADRLELVSAPDCAATIERVLEKRTPEPLTQAALEVLAVVAYEQPVTRAVISHIRGTDSSAAFPARLPRRVPRREIGRQVTAPSTLAASRTVRSYADALATFSGWADAVKESRGRRRAMPQP
jgi:hypothetical protein